MDQIDRDRPRPLLRPPGGFCEVAVGLIEPARRLNGANLANSARRDDLLGLQDNGIVTPMVAH